MRELFNRLLLQWLRSKGIKDAIRIDGFDDFAWATERYSSIEIEYETEIYYSTSLTNEKKQWLVYNRQGRLSEFLDELLDMEVD